jgi:D-3-phosphoglycerate dehydrogenase
MNVGGYDPYRGKWPRWVTRHSTIQTLLESSDIVTVHVSGGEATRGLVGHTELACMKPGAVVVNTSRASVVDEDALAEAILSGRLGGAGIDVISGEPYDVESSPLWPLLGRANLVATPHIGGATVEAMAATECWLAEQVAQALAPSA